MNIEDLAEDSDTSDEDYVPAEKQEDIPSEVDSDGEPEEPVSDSDSKKRGQKRKKQTTKVKKKSKNNYQQAGNSSFIEDENKPEEKEDKKTNVDDIWADFMKDTGFRPKNSKSDNSLTNSKSQSNSSKVSEKSEKPSSQRSNEKVKITQIFEFAGEEVKVEKEVATDSAEARLLNKTPDEAPKSSMGRKGGGLSGICNVLSQLGKKPKISTLEKSKLDWDKFKKEENIEEELQTHNKGKDGFLERQDFLQRADLRRFEIEKDIRAVERNKRFNSTL